MGNQEQRLRELREPVDLLGGGAKSCAELIRRLAMAKRQLELRPQERERRPQLVPGVRDELPLALERRLQAAEHRVQGRGEPLQLVTGPRHGKPPAGSLGRDCRRPAPHRLHLSEGQTREEVAG